MGYKKKEKFGGIKPLLKPHFAKNKRDFVSFLSAGRMDPSPAPCRVSPLRFMARGDMGTLTGSGLEGRALRARQNICKKINLQGLCRWPHQRPVITPLSPGFKSTGWLCQADKGPGALAQAQPSQSSIHFYICFPTKGSQKEMKTALFWFVALPTEPLSLCQFHA